MLRQFARRGWIKRETSRADRRHVLLALTRKGSATLRPLEARSDRQVRHMLAGVSPDRQRDLLQAMRSIAQILAPDRNHPETFLLRPHQSGDLGWIVYLHGLLYSREYRYDERFEALVAGIAAEFIQHFDPARDRCWIAERSGERAGCVMLVHKSATVAKLRLLIVEPSARGLGIGQRLVEECIRFARQVGYKKIVLWTQSELQAARSIYEKAGFQLRAQQPHRSWGREDLVAETWELRLANSAKSWGSRTS